MLEHVNDAVDDNVSDAVDDNVYDGEIYDDSHERREQRMAFSYPNRAMLFGVIKPILGKDQFKTLVDGGIQFCDAAQGIQENRNRLFETLVHTGWSVASDPDKYQQMLRCPPFILAPIKGQKRNQTCRHKLVCPFCYGRMYLRVIYKRAAAVLFPGGRHDQVGTQYPVLTTVLKTKYNNRDFTLKDVVDSVYACEGKYLSKRSIWNTEKNWFSSKKLIGACIQNVFYEGFDDTQRNVEDQLHWVYERRCMFLTAGCGWPRLEANADRVTKSYVGINRKKLAYIVGNLFHVPDDTYSGISDRQESIRTKQGQMIKELLDSLKGKDTVFYSGQMRPSFQRKKKNKERAAIVRENRKLKKQGN